MDRMYVFHLFGLSLSSNKRQRQNGLLGDDGRQVSEVLNVTSQFYLGPEERSPARLWPSRFYNEL